MLRALLWWERASLERDKNELVTLRREVARLDQELTRANATIREQNEIGLRMAAELRRLRSLPEEVHARDLRKADVDQA